jgi:hypothetical protein
MSERVGNVYVNGTGHTLHFFRKPRKLAHVGRTSIRALGETCLVYYVNPTITHKCDEYLDCGLVWLGDVVLEYSFLTK